MKIRKSSRLLLRRSDVRLPSAVLTIFGIRQESQVVTHLIRLLSSVAEVGTQMCGQKGVAPEGRLALSGRNIELCRTHPDSISQF